MSIELINHSLIDDANLKAYYRYESGALTTDSSGEGHTLTGISDPAEDASGKFGGAVALDGDDGYSAVDHADFKPTGNFTIGAWFKTSTSAGDKGIVASYNYDGTDLAGIVFLVEGTKLRLTSWKDSGATGGTITGATAVTDGAWHFGVVTWNGTHLNLYLDGASDAATVAYSDAPVYQATNYVRVGLQTDARGGSPANISFFTGSLDDVFLINGTALSEAQILNIYQNYILVAEAGSFVLTGIDSTLTKSLHLIAETGSFVLTGMAATFSKGYTLVASVGEFTLTGIDVVFSRGYNLVCEVGEFTLTGIAVALKKLKIFSWTNTSKNSTNWTKPSKQSTGWTKPTNSNTNWTKPQE